MTTLDTPARFDLPGLLAQSAAGDADAFMRFYDATCDTAYRLARCSLVDPVVSEQAVLNLYVAAWRRITQYAGSGLSPLAWLLASPLGGSPAQGWIARSSLS